MRLVRSCIGISLIVGALSVAVSFQAQSPVIQGPSLGFTPDEAGSVIWPIIGVPGASMLAQQLNFDAGIRGAVVSPKQDYAIAARTGDAQTVVIDLTAATPVDTLVAGIHPGADVIAVSPAGSAAAVYDAASRTVQVIGTLPHTPGLVQQFDASLIPGRGTAMAITDDGTIALMIFVDADNNTGLWVLNASRAPWRVSAARPSAAAFFPNRQDAIVTDDATRSAFLIMDIGHAATPVPLLFADGTNSFSSVAASEDSKQVFLADIVSGTITIVNVQTGTPVSLSCQCRPTGFYHLKGTSIFRLNEPSAGVARGLGAASSHSKSALERFHPAADPVMVLDASSSVPRIVLIPSKASTGTGAR